MIQEQEKKYYQEKENMNCNKKFSTGKHKKTQIK